MSYRDYKIENSKIIPEIIIISPSISWDLRGNIYSSFNTDFYHEFLPIKLDFKHDKFAQSKFNVLRGLHGDNKTWKLVSCVWGDLFEVVVDMRPDSITFKKHDVFELSSINYKQVLIPPGFINGYYVKSEFAVFHYKLAYSGDYIDAGEQMTFHWNDPELGIEWPCNDPILQSRDNSPK